MTNALLARLDELLMQNNEQIADLEAIVDKAIYPGKTGRVRFAGAWWYARSTSSTSLSYGDAVKIVGREGITLLVQPLSDTSNNKAIELIIANNVLQFGKQTYQISNIVSISVENLFGKEDLWSLSITFATGSTCLITGHNKQSIDMAYEALVRAVRTPGSNENFIVKFEDSSFVNENNSFIDKEFGKSSFQENDTSTIRLFDFQELVQRGDRAIAFSAGGAFLGGLIAQVPGAIVGALAGAIFGWFEKNKPANSSENSR